MTQTSPSTFAHLPTTTFNSVSPSDSFGSSVSGAGDVNGDGFDDVIVGARGADNNGSSSGSAQVFSGANGSVLYSFDGNSFGDALGTSVSGAGDVNGDGFDDVIVGSSQDDNNGFFSGSARVYSGVDGSMLYNFDGDSAQDQFGFSVSGAGDVNGDGFADLIVGAHLDDNNGENSGSARVFSGVDGSVLYNFDGDSAQDQFGFSVSGAGDVNGDGFDDLIVGGQVDNNGLISGNARVFSGVDGSVLYNFDGDSNMPFFNVVSVSGAGDVNGDGFADLIVGAPADGGGSNTDVLSGADGSVLYNFDSDSNTTFFNEVSVSGAGDVDGDGFADLIVGDTGDTINGSRSGSARVYSGVDGSLLYEVYGDSPGDMFGGAVSSAGDVNGDGFADFIIGARTGGTRQGGYARLFVSQAPAGLPILGDVNQDGAVDFSDIAAFIAALQSGMFLPEADANQDGELDFSDIGAFIEILQAS